MDRLAARQAEIEARREQAVREYPSRWSEMIGAWQGEGGDRVWMTYSASYLLRTGGVRWVLDPATLSLRVPQAAKMDTGKDLYPLSFVLLTHKHADHLDLDLIRALKDAPIRWVVPEPILSSVVEGAGIAEEKIIVPRAMEKVELCGVSITPFNGSHWQEEEKDGEKRLRGVPAMGYLVEQNGKRWLFPGDTRTYDASVLPNFDGVDAVFAHVWLGRRKALEDPPPLLEEFCRFFLDLQPGCLYLTHLHEFGRSPFNYWDNGHARWIITRWQEIAPQIPVAVLRMGESAGLE